jgi:hypothetical protein
MIIRIENMQPTLRIKLSRPGLIELSATAAIAAPPTHELAIECKFLHPMIAKFA